MLDDDDVQRKLRLELDLVERRKVGRIGYRDREPVAALAQREHPLRGDEFLVDDVARQLLQIERREIEDRMAEGVGRESSHATCRKAGDVGRVDQLIDELRVGLRRLAGEVLGTVRPQLALLNESTRETGKGPCSGRRALRDCRHGMELSLMGRIRPKL